MIRSVLRTLILCGFLCAALGAQSRLFYHIDTRPSRETPGAIHVRIEAEGCPVGDVTFMIPAWKPGHYQIEEWQRRIRNVAARDGEGNVLKIAHADGERSWTVKDKQGEFVAIEYDTTTTHATKNWLSIEGPETLMFARGATNVPCPLKVEVPEKWTIECALVRETAEIPVFNADDYDDLVDAPLEIGELTTDTFEVAGKPHILVYNQPPLFDRKAMVEMTRTIVEYQASIMGGLPYARYYFMWHLHDAVPGTFMGGLEHRASTTLYLPQRYFKNDLIEQTASLVAHEYFHLWNVKRIRPWQLGPFDYTSKVPVRSLWLLEGVTDYYADETCRRTGLWSESRWLRQTLGEIQALYGNASYGDESAEASSLAAFDRPGGDGGIDYYNLGKLLGLLLDIEIRAATNNEKCLDDLMRVLFQRFGAPRPGYHDPDIATAIVDVSGVDMRSFLKDYVEGARDLPFEQTLAKAGMIFKRTEAIARAGSEHVGRLYPAIEVRNAGTPGEPRWIVSGDPGKNDLGLATGDEVVAFDGEVPRAPTASRTFVGRNVLAASRRKNDLSAKVVMSVRTNGVERQVSIAVPTRRRFTATTLEYATDVKDPLTRAIMDGRREVKKKSEPVPPK